MRMKLAQADPRKTSSIEYTTVLTSCEEFVIRRVILFQVCTDIKTITTSIEKEN